MFCRTCKTKKAKELAVLSMKEVMLAYRYVIESLLRQKDSQVTTFDNTKLFNICCELILSCMVTVARFKTETTV